MKNSTSSETTAIKELLKVQLAEDPKKSSSKEDVVDDDDDDDDDASDDSYDAAPLAVTP